MPRLIAWVRNVCKPVFISDYHLLESGNSRFAEGDVSLHLVNINFSDRFLLGLSVHVDVHDVLGDSLV
jgi:hypothetical protein